jgi:hypothetical protein
MKYLIYATVAVALAMLCASCQPVNDGASGMKLVVAGNACHFGDVPGGAGAVRSMQACVVITTSGATSSVPTTTTTPTTTVTVPVSAVPPIP